MDTTISWEALTPAQQAILKQGQAGHAFTIGDWEEERRRQADELVRAGLLTDGGLDRFNGHHRSYSVNISGRDLLMRQRPPLPSSLANIGIADFNTEQQLRINAALVTHFYDRTRRLMIELETALGNHGNYGTTVMNDEDRLFNRIMAALIITDMGLPGHDTESLDWLESVLATLS